MVKLTNDEAISIKSYIAMGAASNIGCKYAMTIAGRGYMTITRHHKGTHMSLLYWHDGWDEDEVADWSRTDTPEYLYDLIDDLTTVIYDTPW